MSDYNKNPEGWQAPARHRRSDRHRQAESAQQPVRGQEEEIQWSRRAPDGNFAPDPETDRPSVRLNEDDREDFEDEEEADYGSSRFPWAKVICIAAAALVLLCGASLLLKDAGPLTPLKNAVSGLLNVQAKAPAEALSFQAASTEALTNSRVVFNLTTNQSVDGVKLVDVDDNEITATATLANGENETNRIWSIQAVFDEPYTGNVYAMIRSGDTWMRTDKSVALAVTRPTPAPTETPPPTQVPVVTAAPATAAPPTEMPATDAPPDAPQATETVIAAPTWAPTNPPAPAAEETPAPTALPTLEPTEVPTQAPTAPPTMVPTASPLPKLEAQSGGLKITEKAYQGSKAVSYQRQISLSAPNPDNYSYYEAGVLTFRGDNFRRNAAFGTVNVEKGQLSVLWKSEIGSLRTKSNGTLYGVGWTGQPAIVKWTSEVRQMMNLYEDKKNALALREVIFGAQDGKIYFLDLRDGTPTRDPINVGYPLKGSVAVDTYGRPLIAVGQGISNMPDGKQHPIGLHVYYLTDGTEAFLLNGRKSNTQVQYTTNGAFDGTPLFLYENDAMVVAGENGLLYTVDLNSKFVYPKQDDPDVKGSLALSREVTYLRTKADAENDNLVSVESSVAMYDQYVFMADTYGVVRCVDTDTMKTVWAIDCGDNTDAALALDMDEAGTLSLYTGNTAFSRLGKKTDVTIRRLNAMTGEEIWSYQIKAAYNTDQASGCKASPVIGQHSVKDLVYFTVNRVDGASRLVALNKQTGAEAWSYQLSAESVSSPVAVYNENGDAWIIQGDAGGSLTMLEARTGKVVTTLNLGGVIEGSPAVYKNYLVIGTCSKDNSSMYGILIE